MAAAVATTPDDHPAMVGRAGPRRALLAACEEARTGTGRLVVVSGPPGIGKTRLVESVAHDVEGHGTSVAWGRCWDGGGAPPLWPWQPLLDELPGPGDGSLIDGDRGAPLVDRERFARFEAVAAAVAAAARERPLLLVVEDAHAADAGSLLLTRFVVRSLARLPVVVVVTRRTGHHHGADRAAELLDALDEEGTTVPVDPLTAQEAATLLAHHGLDDLDPSLAAAVAQITGGNPLFLQRVAAMGAPTAAGRVPRGVREAIVAAVGSLGADAADLLGTAAILGRDAVVAEVAAVAGRDPSEVLEVLRRAARAGLVGEVGRGRVAFVHDVVREVLEASLPPARLLDGHARAAALAGTARAPTPATEARRAHHALRAASRSRDDAEVAVEASRAAARTMVRSFAYEQASELLATAVRLHDEARLDDPAPLLVERAQAVLLSGRLAEARHHFAEAAVAAERAGEPVLLAEAALGLGGVWANEHRSSDEWERVHALQRRARAGLPEDEAVLRCRLDARLAADACYRGGPVGRVRSALAEARSLGDAQATAEALSLLHHVLLAPEHLEERAAVADELLAVAAEAHDGLLSLMGLCWRGCDLFERGDPGAVAAHQALRARCDATGNRSLGYIAEVQDVMLLIRAGRLAEAEERAGACSALGLEVGDADALAYHGAHLLTIWWLQGRDDEAWALVEDVVGSETLIAEEFTFRAARALVAARRGDLVRARALLGEIAGDGLERLVRSSSWLSGMVTVVEAAHLCRDAALATSAASLCEPFRHLPVMPSLAVVDLGSTERALGLACLTAGDPRAAIDHLERAVAAEVRLGNRPFAATSRGALARALLDRGDPGDAVRARRLLEAATAAAARMGMARHEAEWAGLLDAAALTPAPTGDLGDRGPSGPAGRAPASVVRRGRGWEVSVGGRRAVVGDLVGMRYLARLVAEPGVEVPAVVLASGGVGVDDGATSQPVIDERAREAYRRRAEALVAEVRGARARGDADLVARLEAEADALADELEGTRGLGGRRRSFAGPVERARTSVRKAIARALREVAAVDPVVGDHLAGAVTTGARCRYTPGGATSARTGTAAPAARGPGDGVETLPLT